MVMSWIFTGFLALAILASIPSGNAGTLSRAVVTGAQSGVTLALSLAGSICLWSGVGTLLEKIGVTAQLARILRPLLHRIFPSTRKNATLAGALSGNICANFLGLGNVATPMGIVAAKQLRDPAHPDMATDELCRLIVLNTASIQLLPTNVAAIRAGLGCASPFDILPAVWLTSICSASLGVACAWLLGKVTRHG